MNALVECLEPLSEQQLNTVLYVGTPGADFIESCAALHPRRLVVACPDAEAAADLRRETAAQPWIDVRHELVAPDGGTASWRRFNVRVLNSLLQPARVREIYPRLAEVEVLPTPSIELGALVARELGAGERADHLLVLDLPGSEDVLLAGAAPGALAAVRWIALRGVDPTLYTGAAAPQAAVARLRALHFRPLRSETRADPLWPAWLLEFDAISLAAQQRAQACEALERTLAQVRADAEAHAKRAADLALARDDGAQKLDAATQARARIQTELEALRARSDQRAAELAGQLEAVARERDALARSAQEQAEQLRTRQAAIDEGKQAQAAAQRRFDEAQAAAQQRSDEAQARVTELQARVAELQSRVAALAKANEEQARILAEREKLAAASTQAKATAERLAETREAAVATLTREKGTLAAARDEQARLANERQRRVVQLEADLADLTGRQGLLQEELIKAEAQIELIADLVWREGKA